MQNLYKYTNHFKPLIICNSELIHKTLQSLQSLQFELINNPPDKTEINYKEWKLSYHNPLKSEYYNILYIYAKLCRVKLMWRNIISRNGFEVIKGLWIIGEKSRIHIFDHIMTHYFRGYLSYQSWLKNDCKEESIKAGYRDVRSYASKLLDIQRDTIYVFIKKLLEEDKKYELWLENVIKERFNLDYKKYRTDKREYYHAISKKFYHKRMLL